MARDRWSWANMGLVNCNSNGELLLALCSELVLIMTNSLFKQKDERKTTWMHPRSGLWHMIDFIITRCRDKMDILSTRAMRVTNCLTDHQMLRSKVAFRIRQKHNRLVAVELQRAADRNNTKGFYNGPKEVWGPKKKGPVHLKSSHKLLNVPGDIDREALGNIPQRIIKRSLDEIPTMDEKARAIVALKDGKHLGEMEFLLKYGSTEETISGKIFARILLNRLSTHITPEVVPETQCGFSGNRNPVDMIFCLRQIQEKCVEQNRPLYMVFVDFSKVFDTVGMTGLWQLLRKYGYLEKFTTMIEAQHLC
ncbi:hypothetical protein NP493_485g00022 [Ridgeia piscesae]|uniref:Reverse transcriptase domain-containing protein n=1 Tax=Ridgeia piscesae TaxID=27915 RepID=A0AAD9KY95_RIDPI|nr:hypothetical protein NP493_485g00022 [Ridgeia piscesae]